MGAALYNQFIVDVSDDEAVPEGLQGMAEDIAADGLDNFLHELRTVGLDAFPFLCGAYAFIGDRFPAEPVLADAGLHVSQIAPGRKPDEEHAALVIKAYSIYFCLQVFFYGYLDGAVNTFLQQKQIYEQIEERLKDKIRQQKEAVERLEDEADAMPDGFSAG